ncbi:hypothetical protein B0H14DRAFT_2566610 [Mycena olivaceomarginata]|nr:hypothetical protein B0H14DRAFT_2566610 [Mycena olivaceomarginata]
MYPSGTKQSGRHQRRWEIAFTVMDNDWDIRLMLRLCSSERAAETKVGSKTSNPGMIFSIDVQPVDEPLTDRWSKISSAESSGSGWVQKAIGFRCSRIMEGFITLQYDYITQAVSTEIWCCLLRDFGAKSARDIVSEHSDNVEFGLNIICKVRDSQVTSIQAQNRVGLVLLEAMVYSNFSITCRLCHLPRRNSHGITKPALIFF